MSKKINENETNKQTHSTAFIAEHDDKKLFKGMIFPMDFYDSDGNYIPVTVSYRDAIMREITTGRLTVTPEMIAQLNPTPEEIVAMQQCQQKFTPLAAPMTPGNDVLSAIMLCHDMEAFLPHELAMRILDTYGIRRYKRQFYLFYLNHYILISDETLMQIIYGTFSTIVENTGDSEFVEKVVKELKHNPRTVINDQHLCTTKVAFNNCYFDLNSGLVEPATDKDVMLYSLNANFRQDIVTDPYLWKISTPNFDHFLEQITGGDVNLIKRIWEMLGYVLTPDNNGRAFFVLQGVPSSGKSTLERLISCIFSDGSVFRIKGDDFGSRFSLMGLEGKAVIISSDLPAKELPPENVSVIKQISGKDPIFTDVKYGEPKSFRCDAKMLFFTNHVFLAKNHDTAFYSRAVVIPFKYSINRDSQDYSIDARLASEIDAIATKAMRYYSELRMRNYTFSGDYRLNECVQSTALTADEALTSIDCFVNDCCIQDPDGCTYIEDAHKLYCSIWGDISVGKFSSYLQSIAMERFGAAQDRRRKTAKGNPQSCLIGITLKA